MSHSEELDDSFQELESTPPSFQLENNVNQEFSDDWLACDVDITKESIVTKSVKKDKKGDTSIEGELDFEDEVVNGDIDKQIVDNDAENTTFESEDNTDTDRNQSTLDIKTKKDESIEEGEDDGELSEDGDLEEGEVRDGSPSPKQPSRQVCRFYSKGQCTWGNVCRFLHLSGNEKGNYNMFASSPKYSSSDPAFGSNSRQLGGDFVVNAPLMPLILSEPTPIESAWEKGLKTAKELVKKANKRKEEEPDFDEKRLNLSLQVNERIVSDYPDNDSKSYKKKKRQSDSFKYDEEPDIPYEDDREMKENWRGGRYENFEIRWTREENNRDRRDRDRGGRNNRMSSERDRYSRSTKNKDKWRADDTSDVHTRARADAWIDPWRRSKSPKGNRLSRSRSGSYSSVSSYSYSDRGSSRSSASYSRSSSRSSDSSRSPVHLKRKPSPRLEPVQPSKKIDSGRFNSIKKKPGASKSSSRSRSISRTPSVSRSRSYSRSISMDSVSSASSSISGSSTGSESKKHKNSNFKKGEAKNSKHTSVLVNQYPEAQSVKIPKFIKKEPIDATDVDAVILEQERTKEVVKALPFPSLQHLLPSVEKVKEPSKGPHKQPIKLTLLNKAPPSKATSLQKKDSDSHKTTKIDDSSKSIGGQKRPLSPSAPTDPKATSAPKKSASSRRDELLKQLKAVEDAIARKRSKV